MYFLSHDFYHHYQAFCMPYRSVTFQQADHDSPGVIMSGGILVIHALTDPILTGQADSGFGKRGSFTREAPVLRLGWDCLTSTVSKIYILLWTFCFCSSTDFPAWCCIVFRLFVSISYTFNLCFGWHNPSGIWDIMKTCKTLLSGFGWTPRKCSPGPDCAASGVTHAHMTINVHLPFRRRIKSENINSGFLT